MSSDQPAQCQQLKTNGTRCGSPAQRDLKFCYFHQRSFPTQFKVDLHHRNRGPFEILLPAFEDAISIQVSLHQLTELILRNRIDHKVAGLALYALQIASSNLKRAVHETAPPAEVVVDLPNLPEADIAAAFKQALGEAVSRDEPEDNDLSPGTIQACQSKRLVKERRARTKLAHTKKSERNEYVI